jgi:hypothetical protein
MLYKKMSIMHSLDCALWTFLFECRDIEQACLFVRFACAVLKVTPKMRSAQTPCGIWAIMKKFIYECNVEHYMYPCFCIVKLYYLNMNKL